MEYSALNRADIMMREGRYPNQKEPRPLGLEGAGKVVKLGKNAENALEVGDSVMCLFPGGGHVEFKNVNFKEFWLIFFVILYGLETRLLSNHSKILNLKARSKSSKRNVNGNCRRYYGSLANRLSITS